MSRPYRSSVLGIFAVFFTLLFWTAPTPVAAQDGIRVSISDTSGAVGDVISLPIKTGDLSGEDIVAYRFDLVYNEDVLNIQGANTSGTITPSSGLDIYPNRHDTLRVIFSGTEILSGSGVLMELDVEVVGEGSSPLEFVNFQYQDNIATEVSSSTVNGGVTTNVDEVDVGGDGRVDFEGTGVGINFSGVSGSGAVRVARYDLPPSGTEGISESNVSRYRFVLDAGSGLSFGSNTEVRFDVGEMRGIDDPNNVTIYTRSSSGEGSFSALSTSYDSDANELYATTDSFSEFVMASNTEPLPVEIVDFDAQRQGRTSVQLRWQTASETNNAGFVIQRLGDSSGWSKIGFVEGNNTTSRTISYRFTDQSVPYEAESVQYRLKQVDEDGSAHFGPSIEVSLGAPKRVALKTPYPNPTSSTATVRFTVPNPQKVTLQMYDVTGRRIKTLVQGTRRGRFEQQIDTADLPSGVYLMQLQTENAVKTERLTVVR